MLAARAPRGESSAPPWSVALVYRPLVEARTTEEDDDDDLVRERPRFRGDRLRQEDAGHGHSHRGGHERREWYCRTDVAWGGDVLVDVDSDRCVIDPTRAVHRFAGLASVAAAAVGLLFFGMFLVCRRDARGRKGAGAGSGSFRLLYPDEDEEVRWMLGESDAGEIPFAPEPSVKNQ